MTDKSTPIKDNQITNLLNSPTPPMHISSLLPEPPNPIQTLINQAENIQKNQNYTFKIIKRRAPWNKKEDDAIIELVKKYGTSNWTIIANEMALLFKSKHRNGKQCRERWHNHLAPDVNKENWTEEEENILFSKHLEYGNKWSDISKFLPGRTDNSIKNHFYSKLRKFIRKILKQINKENLLKNNGIDYCKYNSDKVYKLLKKYKVSYKNVTKDTILDMIISTEKNQKGKFFGINTNEENKIINHSPEIINQNEIINIPKNINYTNPENNISENIIERQIRNNSDSKKISNKIFMNKKPRAKKVKSQQQNNINNINIMANNKHLFQSNIVQNINPNLIENMNNMNIPNINNINILPNQANIIINNITNIPYQRKTKSIKIIQGEQVNFNNENSINGVNQIEVHKNNSIKNNNKGLNQLKNKDKLGIRKKDKSVDNTAKLLNKKRRKKKRKKVSISISTPENKKDRIDRIMPRRKYIYGLGHKIQIQPKKINTSTKKNKLNREDFDPMMNDVEIVREGLEIHSKFNILMDKSLLTEKLFPDRDFIYKPKLNINIPISPKIPQFPSKINSQTFDKNFMVGQPTPMEGYYEQVHTPLIMFPPSSRGIYKVDLGYENNFLKKNIGLPFTPHGRMGGMEPMGGPMMVPQTPKREISMTNKIIIQNNNNSENINENSNFISKKPPELNLDIIQNENNDIGLEYPPFIGMGDNQGPLFTKQSINTPNNIFRLSPTTCFIEKKF